MPTSFTQLDHDAFVAKHGERLAWRRASKCPCGVTEDPQRIRPSCKVCHGFGFRYSDPQTIIGLVTGVQHQKTLLQIGVVMIGDLMLGLSPLDFTQIADWDSFKFLARDVGTPYDGDLRVRDADGPLDYLTYEAKQVYTCFSIDPVTQLETTYVQGTDFTVSGRELTWLPKTGGGFKGPQARQKYSVKYSAEFDWIAFVTPMTRYDGEESIGMRAILRKRHLAVAPTSVPF